MATRTWNGDIADWNTDSDWDPATSGNDVPSPGDTAVIASGTVILTSDAAAVDQLFETNEVTLGGGDGATLLLRNQYETGRYFRITNTGSATIEADGNRGFAGSISTDPSSGATLTLKGDPGGNLILLDGGSFNVGGFAIDVEGNVTVERDAVFDSQQVVNNGILSILSGTTDLRTNSLTGTGTISISGYGTLKLPQFAQPMTQTISFAGRGGTLDLTSQNLATPEAVTGFAPGDFIDFLGDYNSTVSAATVDATAHTLTIDYASGSSYVVSNFYGAAGALTATRQTNDYDLIGYASDPKPLDVQIDAGARAMHEDVAHTMTVPGTATPITGAGVKVGIISDSFDVNGNAATDVASGYLPAGGVTVLREGPTGSTDEGCAMAELIYQGAPGAKLYSASTGSGIDDFASSVQDLKAAGCTVIVDDIGLGGEPFFQLGSPAENAISDAIAGGVTFVSSTGNTGNAFYQHAFTTSQQTLVDGSSVRAMTFGNGTPYQSVTATGGSFDTIDLQWDAPFYGTGGVAADQPCSVVVKAFNPTTNALVGTSTQVSEDGHLVAESELDLPFSNSSATYNLAIYQTDGTPTVSQIKYVMTGESPQGANVSGTFGSGVGGRINDPDAGVGSGTVYGHQLIPGVIAVAAEDVTNTSAFARSPDFSEYFSSTGPGTLLFDANGNRYAQPATAGSPDLTGPDGIQTSVTGFTPFYGTSAAAPGVASVAALLQQANPNLTPADIASILAQSALPLSAEPDSTAGSGLVQADRAIVLAEEMACYCAGTRISTAAGLRRIETLAVGERVVTSSGGLRPIRWLGHRTMQLRCGHPRLHEVLPIRIAAHAFGPMRPARNLMVSPGHAICVDVAGEVLIPAGALINGTTITQIAVEEVTYWHVELESHDILLAENLPAESFLDLGNRRVFTESTIVEFAAVPDASIATHGAFCRPFHADGPVVEAVRARLAARGHRMDARSPTCRSPARSSAAD